MIVEVIRQGFLAGCQLHCWQRVVSCFEICGYSDALVERFKNEKAGRLDGQKLPKSDVKHVVTIRLTEEKQEYGKRADQSGVPLSEWIRDVLRERVNLK